MVKYAERGKKGDSMILQIKKWWKQGCLFLLLCLLAGSLTACGSEKKTISLAPDTGEALEVTLDGGDGYSMDHVNGVLMVYQKKKLMMQIALISREQEEDQRKSLPQMPSIIHKEDKDSMTYSIAGPKGMVNYYIYPVGEKTWAYGATYLPPEAAEKVLARIHFSRK